MESEENVIDNGNEMHDMPPSDVASPHPPVVQKGNWNDYELIHAYDRAMMNEERNENNSNDGRKSLAQIWNVGDNCRAKYSDDGLYYEAHITRVDGNFCSVQFWGYDDFEEVALKHLLESAGKRARSDQIKSSEEEMESEGILSDMGDETHDMPPYHVSPPHPPGAQVPPVNEEWSDISPILHSWYWAGYHSGMYAAQEGRRSRFEERRSRFEERRSRFEERRSIYHRRNHWHRARSPYNRR